MSVDTVVGRYGIDARFNHDLVEIPPDKREAVFVQKNDPAKARVTIGYDILHVAPPQIAPEFIPDAGRFRPSAQRWVLALISAWLLNLVRCIFRAWRVVSETRIC
jgi:hypothetical protein